LQRLDLNGPFCFTRLFSYIPGTQDAALPALLVVTGGLDQPQPSNVVDCVAARDRLQRRDALALLAGGELDNAEMELGVIRICQTALGNTGLDQVDRLVILAIAVGVYASGDQSTAGRLLSGFGFGIGQARLIGFELVLDLSRRRP
jgi:hypothetical protein